MMSAGNYDIPATAETCSAVLCAQCECLGNISAAIGWRIIWPREGHIWILTRIPIYLYIHIYVYVYVYVHTYVRYTATRATKQQLAPLNVSATLILPSAWFCIFKCTGAVRGDGRGQARQTCSYFKSRWVWMWIPKRKHFVLNAMLTIEKKHPYQGHKQLHTEAAAAAAIAAVAIAVAVSVALIMWADLWQWQSENSSS